jgi:putative membrane protein
MAGLLYLPRLFVYHADTPLHTPQDLTFRVMERRLMKAIMIPAMIISLMSGLYLAYIAVFYWDIWFILKALCVILLLGVHFRLYQHMILFGRGENTFRSRYYRILNEVPTVLMVLIVVLVIIKP